MKKFLKTFVITFASSLALLMPAVAMPIAVHAAADIQNSLCRGSDLSFNKNDAACTSTGTDSTTKLNSIVSTVINIFSIVVGIIAVIFIIIGGIKYVTSGGEATNITSAKNTIMYALVGLVVVALAQILVKYVLARVTSTSTG